MAENQHRRGHTWGVKALVLICASVITVGSYYVYDTPSSLYGQLQEHFMFENDEISASTFDLYFNLLYSVYSIPNILLPFLGGHLVDTVGMRVCIVGFSSLVLLGQLLTALGCTVNSMATMLLGRLIFGLGGECVVVGQSAFVSAWFKGGEVAFALGFILSLSRIGSVANDWLSPVIAEMYGVNAAFWVGAFLCLISTGTAFLLACIDDNATRNRKRSASSSIASEADGHKYLKGSYFETPLPSGAATPHQRMASVDEDRSLGRLEGAELQAHLYQRLEHQRQQGSGLEDEELWHLLGFNSMFWLLAVVCLLCYGAVMPFNNIANVFLLTYYIPIKAEAPDGVDCNFKPILPEWRDYCTEVDRARRKAGTLQSIPFIIAAVLTPLLGIVIDVYGRRTLWILLGPLLLFFTHLLLFTEKTVAEVPLAGLGLAYSIVAAVIWPSVPLTVEEDVSSKKCGTAFGILTVFQNLSMAVFPIALAALYELSHNYMLGEIFFMAISLVGILTALVLFIVDERTGAVLRLRSIKNMGASPRHHANYDNASRSPLPSNTILSTPPVRIQARMAVQTPPTTSPQPSSSSERNYLRPPDAVKYGTQHTPTGKR